MNAQLIGVFRGHHFCEKLSNVGPISEKFETGGFAGKEQKRGVLMRYALAAFLLGAILRGETVEPLRTFSVTDCLV